MNRLGAGSTLLYKISCWFVPTIPLAIAFVSWCVGLDGTEKWLKNLPSWFAAIKHVQDISVWLYAFLWPVWLFAIAYRKCGDPWLVQQLQFILDQQQNGVFNLKNCPDDIPKDHNRVTLFRYQKGFFVRHWSGTRCWKWGEHNPFSCYLVPVLRSGHISQKSKVAFYVCDDSDKTEGIAGRAWSSDGVIFEDNLPKIAAVTSLARQKLYAKRTNCNPEMVAKRIKEGAFMPRSMMGIPVRRAGKLWGVIVLDSRYSGGVNVNAPEHYKITLALIERLLERAS